MSEAAIRLHIEPLEEGGYVATSPDVPGLVVENRVNRHDVRVLKAGQQQMLLPLKWSDFENDRAISQSRLAGQKNSSL